MNKSLFQSKLFYALIGIILGAVFTSVPWYFAWKKEAQQANANFFSTLMDEPEDVAEIELSNSTVKLTEADLSWTFKNLKGETKTLEDYKGKVVFLNFWATWCAPCIAELPSLSELTANYKDNDEISFLFLTNESKGKIDRFIKKRDNLKDLSYYNYSSKEDVPTKLVSEALPTSVIINKDGEVVLKHLGMAYWNSDNVNTLLNDLLAKKSSEVLQ
ncbi:TlpA disulfide reductase family protein [Roseivirga sp. E12]|uniref:TlpA family protein disulfide reductase n=1 Tax=Roseivirga sp. E12 TaxID=2819237 RepID=UPI001ABCE9FF|nr:TlpA disulfide reductase family protein [Roseivirga sp. E12]MBO3699099.1 TlpA family protein disulfide reductase [Roseivirga sp. E12]